MNSLAPTVRSATRSDLSTLLQLIHLKAAFDGCPETVQATAQQLEQDFFGPQPLAFVLLAEMAGETVGFATYHRIYSTFLAKPGIWLDDLYVKESFRYRGIGKMLVQRLCDIAQQTGCARLDWTVAVSNANGIQFYERIGATVQQDVRLCRLRFE